MPNINRQLITNVKKNDIKEVTRLLKKGANANYNRTKSLHCSIKRGNFTITQLLIDYGADLNYDHNRALFVSITSSEFEITKILVANGINIDAHCGEALEIAYNCNDVETIELLLKEGINYCKDSDELLVACIYYDNIETMMLLVFYKIIEIDDLKHYFKSWMDEILKACYSEKKINMLEYLITNHKDIVTNDIGHLSVKTKDIKKYNFIKMLVTRNLIDIAD
jgi:ankyrin repeat protein